MKEQEEKVPIANGLLDVRNPFLVKDLIQNLKDNIKGGNINPLEAYTIMKRMGKIHEEVSKDEEIKQMAIDELDKHLAGGKLKSVNLYSAQICKAVVWTGYDFSECGHSALDKINEIIAGLEEAKKLIEEELKLMIIPDGKQAQFGIGDGSKEIIINHMPELIWHDGVGEVVNIKPPKKLQKIGLKYMKV